MNVAAEDDGIRGGPRQQRLDEPLARGGIAVPGVGPVSARAVAALIEMRDQRLLTEQVPARRAGAERAAQPLLLDVAEHRALVRVQLGARLDERPGRTGLARAVLAAVEHEHRREVAEAAGRVEPLAAVERHEPARQWQVLVVRLVGRGAAREEQLGRVVLARVLRGVVVRDFVVVGHEHPRPCGVRGFQMRVRLVDRVALPIVLERVALGRVVRADAARAAAFVDVVADVNDHVERVGGDGAIRRVVALLEVLARRDGERHATRQRAACRGRARAADRALRAAAREAIPVVARGLEAGDLDVDGVRPVGRRVGGAAAHDAAELLIRAELPIDGDGRRRHAATRHERRGREPRPEHGGVRLGIARGDTEREGIVGEGDLGRARRPLAQESRSRDPEPG